MDTTIILPESLTFWLKKENAVALDMIAKQDHIPSSLDWNEAEEFYKTKFAHELVKNDFFLLLRNIWKLTWGRAVAESGNFLNYASAASYEDENYTADEWLSPESVWEHGELNCLLKSNNTRGGRALMTSVWFDDDDRYFTLAFFLVGKSTTSSSSESFIIDDGGWNIHCDENGCRTTTAKANVELKMDSAPLYDASMAAIAVIRNNLELF